MCKIYISTDPDLYRSRSRSLRLHGVATSIRLENLFWQVLAEIAERDGLSVTLFITHLYDELNEAGGDCANFSSFLRVCCGRYLALQNSGRIQAGAIEQTSDYAQEADTKFQPRFQHINLPQINQRAFSLALREEGP